MKKQQLYILAGVGVILIGGAVLMWKELVVMSNNNSSSQEVSQFQDWKTYQNDTMKFSVKYPGVFKIDSNPTDTGHIVSFLEFDENAKNLNGQKNPGYFPVISIYQWKDINNQDLKGGNWEEEKKYTNFQDFLADSEHTMINVTNETSIDGIKAYVLSMPGEIGYEAIMLEYDGGYYRISFPWVQKPLDENIKKKFLSSVKLTK